MIVTRVGTLVKSGCLLGSVAPPKNVLFRNAVTNKKGLVLPEPPSTSMGLLKVFVTVTTGLFIGAGISKGIANFLEENDLFVPSDDDDDDD